MHNPCYLSRIVTELINAKFLLVSKFKMIGILLNAVHGHITKESNGGFPNHPTLTMN